MGLIEYMQQCFSSLNFNKQNDNLEATEQEGKEFLDRADKMLDRLIEALSDGGDDMMTIPITLHVTAKFSAGVLLGIQEKTMNFDIAEQFTKAVKDYMAVMGKDMRIQAIKNKIEENKKKIEEARKQINENEKKLKEELMRFDDDDVVN